MIELEYNLLKDEIILLLNSINDITIATSVDNKTYARTIAQTNTGLTMYFSTSGNSNKVKQISKNSNVALAVKNIQIEGIAENIGHPSKHIEYMRNCMKKYSIEGDTFPAEASDVVIKISPTKITLFKSLDKAYFDILDIKNEKAYRIEA